MVVEEGVTAAGYEGNRLPCDDVLRVGRDGHSVARMVPVWGSIGLVGGVLRRRRVAGDATAWQKSGFAPCSMLDLVGVRGQATGHHLAELFHPFGMSAGASLCRV